MMHCATIIIFVFGYVNEIYLLASPVVMVIIDFNTMGVLMKAGIIDQKCCLYIPKDMLYFI